MDYYKLISEAIIEGEASETMQYTKEAQIGRAHV